MYVGSGLARLCKQMHTFAFVGGMTRSLCSLTTYTLCGHMQRSLASKPCSSSLHHLRACVCLYSMCMYGRTYVHVSLVCIRTSVCVCLFPLLSHRPFIDGQTVQQERMKVLQNFVHNPLLNCIFISKVHSGQRLGHSWPVLQSARHCTRPTKCVS